MKTFGQAWRTLRRYRTRSLLMMIGIVIGISTLTILNSIGEGTRRETMRRFKNMIGTFDTIIVRPGAARMRGMPTLANVPPTLRFDDATAIAALPQVSRVAEVQNAFDVDVKYRERTAAPMIFGVTPNWQLLRGDDVAEGTFLSDADTSSLARVAVLGSGALAALFPGEDPNGKTIRIAGVPFQVIGTLRARGSGPAGGSLDDVIMIPVTTASKRLFNRDFLTMLIAQLKDPERGDDASAAIAALLRVRHRVLPPAEDDFSITSPRAAMAQVTHAGSTLSRILTGVAVLALLIGGIVIMSLMVIAVAERRREIGVRRAAGATRANILQQLLFECVLIGVCGGLAGGVIGLGGTAVVTWLQHLPPIVVWRPFAIDMVLSVGIGLASGLYPAWVAARLDPIEALRS